MMKRRKDAGIVYAGKVGTGFTLADAAAVYRKLAPLEVKLPSATGVPKAELRYIHWVKPSVICEVAFSEWTDDGRIRHGSFQGLRGDKPARKVKREMPQLVQKLGSVRRATTEKHKGPPLIR